MLIYNFNLTATVIIPQPHKLYKKNYLPQQCSNMAYVAY